MKPRSLPHTEPTTFLHGKRVTVMGLGRHGGGVAVSRWLAQQGCRVTVTDLEPHGKLTQSLAQVADVSIERFQLGRHDEADFASAEIVVVNPAVKPNHPLVELARGGGAVITSEIEFFLNRCPATVVGVTGTAGKSTTCTLLAKMLRNAARQTWLGGNIGVSLLPELDNMRSSDVVVLELSSFQLAHLSDAAKLPTIAVITNCSPNHLEWHASWQSYVSAKQRLFAKEPGKQVVILNHLDPEVATWRDRTMGEVVPLIDESLVLNLKLPGEHNRRNAQLAATAAQQLGVSIQVIQATMETFSGLAHRLKFVATVDERRFYNDSKATSVAATIAALAAVHGPTWLLAGGVHQQLPWTDLATEIVVKTKGVAFFGQSRHALAAAVRSVNTNFPLAVFENLSEAVAWAFNKSRPGEAILLSPACPSFDQFSDFAERGRIFCESVHALANDKPRGQTDTRNPL
jgi:UDP-N-acetylmuramoylalanine--D-glutamate ligase